jgi:hypothetical protein
MPETDPMDDVVGALDEKLAQSNGVQSYTISNTSQTSTRFSPKDLLEARAEARRQKRGGRAAMVRIVREP